MLRHHDDDGFTLIETLISVAIMGILIGALFGAMTVTMQTDGATSTRLDESRDEQAVATYFADDVASASGVSGTGGYTCGATDQTVLTLTSEDFDPANPTAPITTTTRYVLHPVASGSGATCELRRTVTGTTTAELVVARYVANASTAGTGSSPPRTVTLTLAEQSGDFTYSLSADRRTTT